MKKTDAANIPSNNTISIEMLYTFASEDSFD